MEQKFKIPVYLILSKYDYDESNEYTMEGYSFDRDEAIDMLRNKASDLACELAMNLENPDNLLYEWKVGDMYTFKIEERYIEV